MYSKVKVITAFLFGAAAGASFGFLMSPDKGENITKKVKEALKDWESKAEKRFSKGNRKS